jgi:hypothetical protein
MAYKQLLSTTPGDFAKNTPRAINFMVEKFGVILRAHPCHENLISINGCCWWVIPATGSQGVDLCNGRDEDPVALVERVRNLQCGILILRQMMDNRLCIYEIRDLDALKKRLDASLILLWDTIEIIKSSSDIGIIIGDEMIGFRKLRKPEKILEV